MNKLLKRVFAFYIDCLIVLILSFIIYKIISFIEGVVFEYLFLVLVLVYYFYCECFYFKTPGKKVMKLRIQYSGSKDKVHLNFLMRTLIRLIPLDALSFIFTKDINILWHDYYSKTEVVLSTLPMESHEVN